jgi:inorganic pyrophosphatase
MQEMHIGSLGQLLGYMFQAHPWHGIPAGSDAPERVTTFIEIVPTDTVKYEVDKYTGHLRVDRPQRYSNVCPSLYGFIPRTYCGDSVAERCNEKAGTTGVVGDGDPLDILVLSEKTFAQGNFTAHAIPIGGLRMIDGNEADDKIIAVLEGDASYGDWRDIGDCPKSMRERLEHYFLTYKDAPEQNPRHSRIEHIYDAAEAHEVIRRSIADYRRTFAELDQLVRFMLGGQGPQNG